MCEDHDSRDSYSQPRQNVLTRIFMSQLRDTFVGLLSFLTGTLTSVNCYYINPTECAPCDFNFIYQKKFDSVSELVLKQKELRGLCDQSER